MVQSPRALAHPPLDARAPSARNRSGHERRTFARFLPPLATHGSRFASARRRRYATRRSGNCKAMKSPAAAWESQVLPARVSGYQSRISRSVVLLGRGHVGPARGASGPRSKRPNACGESGRRNWRRFRFFLREERRRAHHADRRKRERTVFPTASRRVLAEISFERGAPFSAVSFARPKHLASRSRGSTVAIGGGRAGDGRWFDALRALSDAKRRLGEKGDRLTPPRLRAAAGRESLRPRPHRSRTFARRLLNSLGRRVSRRFARECLAPRWRDLLLALRRMEARGEIRGGRFISTSSANNSRSPKRSTHCARHGAKAAAKSSHPFPPTTPFKSSTRCCQSRFTNNPQPPPCHPERSRCIILSGACEARAVEGPVLFNDGAPTSSFRKPRYAIELAGDALGVLLRLRALRLRCARLRTLRSG